MKTLVEPVAVKPFVDLKYHCSTLVELLHYRAQQHPDRTAFVFLQNGELEVNRLTYAELHQQAIAIAQELQAITSVGDRALLVYPSGLEFISAFFGCLYAGIIAVPVYPPRANQNLLRLQAIVTDAQATVALTTSDLIDSLEQRWLELDFDQNLLWHKTDNKNITLNISDNFSVDYLNRNLVNSQTIAFLQYTSGSTGNPKGVMVSHGNVLHNQQMIQQAFGHDSHTVSVGWLPLFHDMGLVGNILQPLYLGQSCFLMSPVDFLQKPIRWLQAISKYGATSSGGPNFAYDLCVRKIKPEQLQHLDLSHWQVAFSGAEPVQANTLEQFTTTFAECGFRESAFHPCYGMAEATLLIAAAAPDRIPLIKTVDATALQQNQVVPIGDDRSNRKSLVSCGTAWLEQTITIVDPITRHRCVPNEIGEIWVQGGSVAQGYWNRPDETEHTFQASIQNNGESPFLRTGDLGFIQNGELFVTGRLKDVIILRGRNYYPQDIESTLENSHPALRKSGCCAAFSVEVDGEERLVVVAEVERRDRHRFRSPAAVIEERRQSNLRLSGDAADTPLADGDAVIAQIRQAIAQEHGISVYGIQFLRPGSIPKTSSGKIQRHACRANFLAGTLAVIAEWQAESLPSLPKLTEALVEEHTSRKHFFSGEAIQVKLIKSLTERLQIKSAELSLDTPFAQYGFDSVEAVGIIADLEDWSGIALTPDVLEQYPTILLLSNYLQGQLPITPIAPVEQHNPVGSLPYRWVRSLARQVYRHGFQLQCEGLEHIPQDRPFLLAANHTSHLDAGAVITALGNQVDIVATFAAQDYFFDHRTKVGFWQKHLNLLSFDRQGNFLLALHDCQRILAPRQPVLIFPEGTRSPTGQLQPFQAGLGLLALRLQVPVVPVAITGAFQALPKGQSWPRRHPIKVRFGTPIVMTQATLPEQTERERCQALVNQVQMAISQYL
jgi:1-acyl-sn-glycerol-3-phosphate acyltransferase